MALSLHSSPFYFLRAGHQPHPRGSRYRSQRPTQALPNPTAATSLSEVISRGKYLGLPGFEPRTPA